MGRTESGGNKIIEVINIILLLAGSIVGGTITGVITVVALKTDVAWLKAGHDALSKRIWHLETKGICK
jgi:hypothetical protein